VEINLDYPPMRPPDCCGRGSRAAHRVQVAARDNNGLGIGPLRAAVHLSDNESIDHVARIV
jgi:hypothetical protein